MSLSNARGGRRLRVRGGSAGRTGGPACRCVSAAGLLTTIRRVFVSIGRSQFLCSSKMELPSCRICCCALSFDVVKVGFKGLNKLKTASNLRQDGKFAEISTGSIALHAKCRASYINDRCISAARKKKISTNSNQEKNKFNYQKQCLFCNNDASEDFICREKKKSINTRNVVCSVKKKETGENILHASFDHLDEWSEEVCIILPYILIQISTVNIKSTFKLIHYCGSWFSIRILLF